MIRLRRILALVVLALAFALGQQALELHELAHALDAVKDPAHGKLPAPDSCPKCFAFAHLMGAAPSWTAHSALAEAGTSIALFTSTPAPARTVVHAQSRAPPGLS